MNEYYNALVRQAEADLEARDRLSARYSLQQEIEFGYEMEYIPLGLRLFHVAGRHWLCVIAQAGSPGFSSANRHIPGSEHVEVVTPFLLYLRMAARVSNEAALLQAIELSFVPQ